MLPQSQERAPAEMSPPATDRSESPQHLDKTHSPSDEREKVSEEDKEYVTGVRLILILISMVLVQFLIMLDASIIATV